MDSMEITIQACADCITDYTTEKHEKKMKNTKAVINGFVQN